MAIFAGQFGLKKETTYGTAVTVDRFFEHLPGTTDIMPTMEVMSAAGIRSGRSMLGQDNVVPTQKGGTWKAAWNPATKGFGLALQLALGGYTVGTLSSGKYNHTFYPATLAGISSTMQLLKPYKTAASGGVITAAGCKVDNFKLSAAVDEFLMVEMDGLCQTVVDSTAVATAVYPTTPELFAWNASTLTIGGSAVGIGSFDLEWSNNIDAKFKMASTALAEPIQAKYSTASVKIGGIEFESLTHYNRFKSLSVSGAQAAIVLTCTGLTDTAATLVVSVPVGMSRDWQTKGDLELEQDLTFDVLAPTGGTSPLTITYTTTDTAA